MRICPYCHEKVESDARYCGNCGKSLTNPGNYNPTKQEKARAKRWSCIAKVLSWGILVLQIALQETFGLIGWAISVGIVGIVILVNLLL